MNELILYGTVGDFFWDEEYFTAAWVREQLSKMSGPLTVRINSGGGIATEGQAIYTLLKDYADEVHVVIDAVAASAASLIAMAGDTITMRLGSYMLIHDPAQMWTEGRGTEDDHLKIADQLRVTSGAYAEVYAARAGISRDEAREIMRADTLFDGQAALEAGFATDVDRVEAAITAAVFDYSIYKNAPGALLDVSKSLGKVSGKEAVVAMIAGVPGSKKEKGMSGKNSATSAATAAKPTAAAPQVAEPVATHEPVVVQEPVTMTDTVKERTRVRRILDATAMSGLTVEFANGLIDQGTDEGEALDLITAARIEKNKPKEEPKMVKQTARITADGRDKFKEGAQLSLMMKVGVNGGERNEFTSMTLSELAREAISMSGEVIRFEDRRDMVGRAFTMSGTHTTSDFAEILSNVMGKAALAGWEEAEETYHLWTRKGILTDFKENKRVGAGLIGALPKVAEGANYQYGTIGDRGEAITLATYGRLLRISRQAIINDDLSILGTLPRKMGRAAKTTIGDLVYAILTSNPAMSDGTALFHADHKNLATAAAPSVDSLSKARTLMKTQKEKAGGKSLNIRPAYFLVPSALETAADVLMTSVVDPTASKGHAKNPVAGMAEVISDARLDDASATAWYLAANQNAHDTIEVAYLDGVEAPYLEEQTAWTSDGVEMKVRIDAGVAPLDFRTMVKNAGA